MYECPKCKGDNLAVQATMRFTAYINRGGEVLDDDGGDTEWDGDSEMRCCDCGYDAHVWEFDVEEE